MGPGMWRHRRMLDLDVAVVKVVFRGPTYIKVKVVFVYRHEGHPLVGGQPIVPTMETVKIRNQDLCNWRPV